MRRRDFLLALGGAGLWPSAAVGQPSALPLIGYLSSRSLADSAHIIDAFRQGLKDVGFIEGQSVAIEYRFADGHLERLSGLAGELVRRPVKVFVATGGIVASLARPGGNITGVSFLVNGLAGKQLQVLRDLVPAAGTVGFLINPNDPNAPPDLQNAQEAADALGRKLVVVKAGTVDEFESAFKTLLHHRAGAMLVQVGPFFADQRTKIAALAARQKIPAMYGLREFVDAGGLISYGTSITAANRQLGVYTGRVLKGTRPSDMPIIQSATFELVVNLKAATLLGLTIPSAVLAQANHIVE